MQDKLLALVRIRMPHGPYAGRLIIDLPKKYLERLAVAGFSQDALGTALAMVHTLRRRGLSDMLEEIRFFSTRS